jgi:hypothetical protein
VKHAGRIDLELDWWMRAKHAPRSRIARETALPKGFQAASGRHRNARRLGKIRCAIAQSMTMESTIGINAQPSKSRSHVGQLGVAANRDA